MQEVAVAQDTENWSHKQVLSRSEMKGRIYFSIRFINYVHCDYGEAPANEVPAGTPYLHLIGRGRGGGSAGVLRTLYFTGWNPWKRTGSVPVSVSRLNIFLTNLEEPSSALPPEPALQLVFSSAQDVISRWIVVSPV